MNSPPIILCGCHRSGTGLLSQILEKIGVFMGNDQNIHHESKAFLRANEELLGQLGITWDNPGQILEVLGDKAHINQLTADLQTFLKKRHTLKRYKGFKASYFSFLGKKDQRWGWKDPRNSILLPLWLELYPEAKVIRIYRNGIHVARSLARREQKRHKSSRYGSTKLILLQEAFELWKLYDKILLAHMNSVPDSRQLHISYEQLIEHPKQVMLEISDFTKTKFSSETFIKIQNTIDQKYAVISELAPEEQVFFSDEHMQLLNYVG